MLQLRLNDLEDKKLIPQLPPYDSDDWYISIIPMIQDYMMEYYGDRQLFGSRKIDDIIRNGGDIEAVKARYEIDIKRSINLLFIGNRLKYQRQYTVMNEHYDPLWNVDGTEVRTYTKDNTGTQGTAGSNTGTQSTSGSNTGTQGTTGGNTGTQTTADGTHVTTEHDVTTYDSQTYRHADKNQESHSGNVTRTDNLSHTETRTDNLSHSETRTDNLSHSETRTDNLKEEYEEKLTRSGNIGVTKSQDLLESELDVSNRLVFIDVVAKDIVNQITSSVYDDLAY